MRQLLPALVASTALHVAVAAAVQAGVPRAPPPVAAPPVAMVEVEVFSVRPGQSAPSASQAVSHATARRTRRRLRSIVPLPVAAPVRGELPTITAEVPEVSAAPAAMASAPPAVASPASASSDLDLSAFFQRLQRSAQLCSGPRAGEGKVRFCVGSDGAPTEVSLVQSTGNFALDDAALHCVIPGAAPFPRTERCLVVPVRFQ